MVELKPKKNRHSLLFAVIVTVLLFVVTVYSILAQNQFEGYARQTVSSKSSSIASEVDVHLAGALSCIQLSSRIVSNSMSSKTLRNPDAVINSFISTTPFRYIEYVDSSGIYTTAERTKKNISNYECYQQGMRGHSGIWINYTKRNAQEYSVMIYSPVYYNGEIVGVIIGVIGTDSDILPLLKNNFFGSEMIGVLCDENGKIITSTRALQGSDSLDDALSFFQLDEETKQDFHQHILSKDNSVFTIDGIKGASIACVDYVPSTGWYAIQIIPSSSFRQVIQKNNLRAYATTGGIAILLLFYLIYITVDSRRKQKKIITEAGTLVQDYSQILSITSAGIYTAIRCLDLSSETANYLHFKGKHLYQRPIGLWDEYLASQRRYVHPDDVDQLFQMLSVEHLRMQEDGVPINVTYRSAKKNADNFHNTYTATITVTTLSGKKTAVITSVDNSPALRIEMEQRRLLSSAASIYISMHVMDLKKETVITLRSSEGINQAVNQHNGTIHETLRYVMSRLTDPEHLPSLLEFIDFSTLDERMKDTNTITLEFLSNQSVWCRARFIVVSYDENHRISSVLWVIENINAEKNQTNHLKYLSETDLMTKLYNRGSGEQKIKNMLTQEQYGLFCLMDADDFKSINDTYGHDIGDKVLIGIATCLRSSFRESDILMRLGGDEYAAYAPGIQSREQATELINRFFRMLEQMDIPELNNHTISISVGAVIKQPTDHISFDLLYREADYCTYASKKKKGNSFTFRDIACL